MVKKCNLVVFNAEMVSIGAKKNELLRPSTLVGASQSNSMKSQSVDLLVERLRRLGSARSARKLSLSIKFQFIGGMKVGEPQTAGAAPLRSWQSSRHEPAVKQLRQPLPFRGAKHFHTAAPMGWRCESAFALLSHQKVTKRLFLAEIYDKIEDGRISGKGAILWELRFRV